MPFSNLFGAIPHNSKCRYGERGAAAAGAVLKPQGGNCEVLPLEKSCPRVDIGRLTLFMG